MENHQQIVKGPRATSIAVQSGRCCCCLPTPPCLLGDVFPYFEVTGHPVPVSSLGFKCQDCFLELSLYCPSFKDERAIHGQLPKVLLHMNSVPDGRMGGRHP